MQVYLVGGAVRDECLKKPIKERDWVVVGATPEIMRQKGFQFYTDPNVTLEEDLVRRDLTINAMAKDDHGKIIDPYGGQKDLKKKLLRHVSPAFAEDPVRILRAARFAAKLPKFKLHPDTLKLMQKMVEANEVNALVAERVWQELAKALNETAPFRFFEVLKETKALPILFPEFQPLKKYLTILKNSTDTIERQKTTGILRFAALCSLLTLNNLNTLCKRYRIPNEVKELAMLVVQFRKDYKKIVGEDAQFILGFLLKTDAFRREERFKQFLIVCQLIDKTLPHQKIKSLLEKSLTAAKSVNKKKLDGLTFSRELKKLQRKAIQKIMGLGKK